MGIRGSRTGHLHCTCSPVPSFLGSEGPGLPRVSSLRPLRPSCCALGSSGGLWHEIGPPPASSTDILEGRGGILHQEEKNAQEVSLIGPPIRLRCSQATCINARFAAAESRPASRDRQDHQVEVRANRPKSTCWCREAQSATQRAIADDSRPRVRHAEDADNLVIKINNSFASRSPPIIQAVVSSLPLFLPAGQPVLLVDVVQP